MKAPRENSVAARGSDVGPASGWWWAAAVAVTLAIMGAGLWFGDLNQDEGWYLYAAGEVGRGRLPFVHFATTQGPVFPLVYAAANPLVARWGVAGGRLFTGLLGAGAVALAVWLAARIAPDGSDRRARRATAWMALLLIGVNVYQGYYFTVVKTYALTALLLMAGLHLLLNAWRGGRRAAFGAGLLLGFAAATRSSAAFAIPVAFGGLLFEAWRARAGRGMRAWFDVAATAWLFAAGAGAALALAYGPFLAAAPHGVWFALAEYHAGRASGGAAAWLAARAGFGLRLASAYFAAGAVAWWLVVRAWSRRASGAPTAAPRGSEARSATGRFAAACWAMLAAVTLVHAAAPFPYDDYQAFLYPLLGALLAAGIARGAQAQGWNHAPAFVAGTCLLAAAASPMIWDWSVGPRDRIWWTLKERTPLAALREAGRAVRALSGPDDEVLTQDTYLAVEAGRRVPPGLEMGPFSYFPDWSAEKAAARHVLNREALERLLRETAAPVAAFSGYGLAIRCPEVTPLSDAERAALWKVVSRRYEPAAEFERFGQASTTLVLLRRRTTEHESD